MSVQSVIVTLIFLAAVFYVTRLVFRSLTAKKNCGGNCKCGIDFSEVDINKPSR